MGFFDRFRREPKTVIKEKSRPSSVEERKDIVVGAKNDADETQIQSFSNSNITFNGELVGYDYGSILRDKQNHIIDLYK